MDEFMSIISNDMPSIIILCIISTFFPLKFLYNNGVSFKYIAFTPSQMPLILNIKAFIINIIFMLLGRFINFTYIFN